MDFCDNSGMIINDKLCISQNPFGEVILMSIHKFLAHLSQRLICELIVYTGIRRPSVVRQYFQTTSP